MPRTNFVLACTSKLFQVIKNHLPNAHANADDTQLYFSFKPGSSMGETEARGAMERRIRAIRAWLIVDRLKLNEVSLNSLACNLAKLELAALWLVTRK